MFNSLNFFKKSFVPILSALFFVFPAVSFADDRIATLIKEAQRILGLMVYIVVGVAVVLFFWGIFKYIAQGDNEEKRKEARGLVLYGIIGLFVMVAVWGLVYFVGNLLGINIGSGVTIPPLPGGDIAGLATGITVVDLLTKVGGWISSLVYLALTLAFVFFLWGVARFITSGADEERRTDAKRHVAFGVLGLFAMVAIWGLVSLVATTIGVNLGSGTEVPQIIDVNIDPIKDSSGNTVVSGGTAKGVAFSCDGPGSEWEPKTGKVSFRGAVCFILQIFNPIPPILIALSMFYFFWGVAKYMNAGGNAEELKKGKNTIIFGILGFFVIITVWALVYLIRGDLGLSAV